MKTNKYNYITKEYLELNYSKNKKSIPSICRDNKCSISVIYSRLKKYIIPIRTMSEALTKHDKNYCSVCKKEITRFGKSGMCRSCQKKEFYKFHPGFNKGILNGKYGTHQNYFKGHKHTEESKKLIGLKSSERLENPINHPNYIDGRSFEPYSISFTRKLKNEIISRDEHKCQNCGMTEEEHIFKYSERLPVHHIDYDKQNCLKKNLITLCKGCNTKANTNRYYWQSFYQQKVKSS